MAYGNYYNPYQNQFMGQPQQYMQPQQPVYPSEFKFMNEAEITAYIVQPNAKLFAVDKDKMMFYIKSTDSMGNSGLERYKLEKLDNLSTQDKTFNFDPKEFVTRGDLNNFRDEINKKIEELKGVPANEQN